MFMYHLVKRRGILAVVHMPTTSPVFGSAIIPSALGPFLGRREFFLSGLLMFTFCGFSFSLLSTFFDFKPTSVLQLVCIYSKHLGYCICILFWSNKMSSWWKNLSVVARCVIKISGSLIFCLFIWRSWRIIDLFLKSFKLFIRQSSIVIVIISILKKSQNQKLWTKENHLTSLSNQIKLNPLER